jgi:hypothetical protein
MGENVKAAAWQSKAVSDLEGAGREERQHVEILAAVLDDRLSHALGLAFEHLREFPEDQLILDMLEWEISGRVDPVQAEQLRALRGAIGHEAAQP